MAVKFTSKQWATMVRELEKKYGATGTEIGTFVAERCAERASSRASKPSGSKRGTNAYMLYMKAMRSTVIAEDFDGKAPKGSEVTKAVAERWNKMSDSEKKPYVDEASAARAELGHTSSPSSPWNFVSDATHAAPEGWSGPFKGKYLAKYAARGRGVGRFETFAEAVAAAEALGGTCGGITLEQKAYTVRQGNDPVTHPNPNQSTYSEASWTKDDFVPVVAAKAAKKPRAKKAEAKKAVAAAIEETTEVAPVAPPVENNDSDDDDDTEDEDDELAVKVWEHEGVKYLLDEDSGDVYDFESQDLIGKRGEGKFAPKKLKVASS